MTDREGDARRRAFWEQHRKDSLVAGLAATPAERLEWLEEVLAFAYEAGAIEPLREEPAEED